MGRVGRRQLLAAGAAAAASMAGCLGISSNTGGADPRSLDPVDHPSIGPDDAAIRIAVFEDFDCGGCRVFNQRIVPAIKSQYIDSGDIQYFHLDFPIPLEWSSEVANAARAVFNEAGDEAFWSFAARIYPQQASYSFDLIETTAETVAGVGETARTAAEQEQYSDAIADDRALGSEWGVDSTPTVFVGDQAVNPGKVLGAIDDQL